MPVPNRTEQGIVPPSVKCDDCGRGVIADRLPDGKCPDCREE